MSERRTNDSKLRNGQLDEALRGFKTEPIDKDSGIILFHFETGGFSVAFKRGMTMTEIAAKLEWTAERVRRYQATGWPMIKAEGH